MADGEFQPTRWSLIERAEATDPNLRRKALEEFFALYWQPLYWFARRSGWGAEDAADLLQDFCALLQEENWLGRADRDLGKLRTFLLTVFKRHLNDARKRAGARKRGGGVEFVQIETDLAEQLLARSTDEALPSLEMGFDREWARTIFDRAIATLRAEMKPETFARIKPLLTGGDDAKLATIAEESGQSVGALKTALSRARRDLREMLRAEVRESLLPGDDLDEEMRYLASVLPE